MSRSRLPGRWAAALAAGSFFRGVGCGDSGPPPWWGTGETGTPGEGGGETTAVNADGPGETCAAKPASVCPEGCAWSMGTGSAADESGMSMGLDCGDNV